MNKEVLEIISQLGREKGIEEEILIDALKNAMETAARKKLETSRPLQIEFNRETGAVEVFSEKTVANEITKPEEEVSLEEAQSINAKAKMGESILVPLPIENFGRIAAQLAKQVIVQKVREAEIDIIYKDFQDKKGELINGIVQHFQGGDIIVELGKAEGILPRREQVFRESFSRGDRIRAYVLDIGKTARNATVILSRTHTGLIKNLFELEVPEINEGIIEIMGIVREPNGRTKIAVKTNDRDVDAVGACVGMRGMRVQSIVQELRGEKIDIVEYSDDPEVFIRNALSPAKVSRIIKNKENDQMTVIVADDQMSLAIGKKGQNVRLAAKLVKLKVDIKGQSEGHDPLSISDLLPTTKRNTSGINFLSEISTAKRLGEKITAILFEGNIVTAENVIEQGIKGLSSLPGIGPKKAALILEFSEELNERIVAKQRENAVKAEVDKEVQITKLPEEQEEQEEQEIPVDQLIEVSPLAIESLLKNGFETLAELSITKKEELMEIDGIDLETATEIIKQAKKQLSSDG
jgi:transcription termination/antitermination protein NusA